MEGGSRAAEHQEFYFEHRRGGTYLESDITPEWLTRCISLAYPGVAVETVATDDFVIGMAGKFRIRVEYNSAGVEAGLPERILVKGGYGLYGEEMDFVYETEMRSYRDILPSLAVTYPQCLFAGRDPDFASPTLILEDLRARDTIFCSVPMSLTYQQTANFLDEFARLHSAYWNSAELETGGKFDWTYKTYSGALLEYIKYSATPAVWEKYMAAPRGMGTPKLFRDRHRMSQAVLHLARLHEVSPKCLVHGDAHLGNTYLEFGTKPGILDWQLKQGPWFQDVAYFMVSALDPVDRRNWERALLAHYLGRLTNHGVAAPGFEEAWLGYRCEAAYGLFIWLVNGSEKQAEEIAAGNVFRFNMAALDHRTLSLLGMN